MADLLNELKQATKDAAAALKAQKVALDAILGEQPKARKALSALLERQLKGGVPEADKEKLLADVAAARAAVEDFDSRIAAGRDLVRLREDEHESAQAAEADEQKRVDAEKRRAPGLIGLAKPIQAGGYGSFGEYLISVHKASQPGERIDQRLLAGPTGLSEGVPSDGGFFVFQEYSSELLRKTFNQGEILKRIKPPITLTNPGSNGLKVNAVAENSRANGSRWGGVQAFWQGEADTKTGSKPTFRQIDLNLKKLTGLCYATDELLQDAGALEGVIKEAFADEFVFKIEDAIYNGTGAGMPLGLLNSPALVTQAIEGTQTIANTDTFIAKNLAKMWGRMHARSQQNAVWLINQEIYNKLLTATLGGTSAVSGIFIAPGRFNETPFATIFGRPCIPVEYAAAEGTPGDIMLVDLETYLFIDKGAPQQAASMHVRFLNDETVFRFVYRADGSPTWNSPLTPYKGTATQSVIVVLNTRS